MKPILTIVTALQCEAKPLISHLRLKKLIENFGNTTPFPVFVNADKSIYLIISGIGKVNAAMATAFLHGLSGHHSYTVSMNIGIAGCEHFSLGDAVLANKVIEASTQRCWYPFTSMLSKKLQTTLYTHDNPQRNYPEIGMVDMEGSAFFQTAARFVTQEQIQILKIISDSDVSHHEKISPKFVEDLISAQLSTIQNVIDYLLDLSHQESKLELNPAWITAFQSRWHFTFNQAIQLKQYLRRIEAKSLTSNPFEICQNEKTAKQVIDKLFQYLELDA